MDCFVKEVNPEIVLLARQSRGLSQKELAERLSITPALLSKMETGVRYVTDANLIKIANVLNYPIDFFLNKARVYGLGVSEIYHRRRQNIPNKTLDKIHAQINIIRMSLAKMLQGVEIGENEFRPINIDEFNGDIGEIAQSVRALWNVPSGPIQNLTKIIEYARGLVIPFEFGTNRIDALSYWPNNTPPLFFINMNIPGDRLRYSLCHELGHIMMHQDYPHPDIERQADMFAAEFLMPEHEIRQQLVDVTLETIALLKPYWKVSMAALLKRATDLGTITPRRARTLWAQMTKSGIKYREPAELDIPVEIPSLQKEILSVYSDEMDYSLSELAKMLVLYESDVCHYFFGLSRNARDEEIESAIEEAEIIIKHYRTGERGC